MRQKKWWKNKKFFLIVGIVLIASCALFFFTRKQATADTSQKIIAQSVKKLSDESQAGAGFTLTGTVVPKDSRQIMLDVKKGKVTETLVKEGDTVTAGQELFRYVNPQGEFAIKEAQLTVDNQQKLLEQRKGDASLKWSQYNQKQADLDNVNARYNAASNEEKEAVKQEQLSQVSMVEQALNEARNCDMEVSNVEIELEKARINLQSVQEANGTTSVTAEIAGVVKKIDKKQLNKSEGSQDVFMEIQDTANLYVEGTVDEFRKNKLAVDQVVDLIDRGDSDAQWTGKVTQVGNTIAESEQTDDESNGDENPNLSKYPYKVQLDNSKNLPLIGRHVYVHVKPTKTGEGVTLPVEYLFQEKGENYVWLIKNKKIVKTKVTLGSEDKENKTCQITKGLTEKDEITYPYKSLTAGMEVGSLVKTK